MKLSNNGKQDLVGLVLGLLTKKISPTNFDLPSICSLVCLPKSSLRMLGFGAVLDLRGSEGWRADIGCVLRVTHLLPSAATRWRCGFGLAGCGGAMLRDPGLRTERGMN
jgi:hypothetical protein